MWTPDASQIVTKEQEEAEALSSAWFALRTERNARINDTQWIAQRAFTTGQPVPPDWAEYWQTLRDLPANTADPYNPEWPNEPR